MSPGKSAVKPRVVASRAAVDVDRLASRFPPNFAWGTATAAYQIEGGWDADGKGESVWDAFCRRPGAIADGASGEVACDHYRLFRDDVELMAGLGLRAYRFSISWPRVLPEGTGPPSEAGLRFYEELVEELLEHGIRPVPTLFHWDLPLALHEQGGWESTDAPHWFAEYAALVAGRLGDRVDSWITLNEPEVVVSHGHISGVHAPGIRDPERALRAAHGLLLAHGAGSQAVRAAAPAARVGIALNVSPCHPASENADDQAAAVRRDGALHRWFFDPVFGRGYPADLAEWYGELVPAGADAEIARAGVPLDFLGLNYYTREVVRAGEGLLAAVADPPAGGERTGTGWEVYPEGLTEILLRVHRDYGPLELLITENGSAWDDVPDADGAVEDEARVRYLEAHLSAAAEAIEAGVPLAGYFAWSLLDNFEWAEGYTKRFGIVRVDYPTQRRTVKASGRRYAELVRAASR
jgi:beta-glucosidase